MKLYITILICFTLSISNVSSTWYYMPDMMLRAKLTGLGLGSCISNDSIDGTCPLLGTVTTMDISNYGVHDLTGIQVLTSLTTLACMFNSPLNISVLPPNLQYLYCGNNYVTSLPNLPSSLLQLRCEYNALTTLPNLPGSLNYLNCSNNQLTTLPSLPGYLRTLKCDFNLISTWPSLNYGLDTLECMNNQLTQLPALPVTMRYLNCSYNYLTNLSNLGNTLQNIVCHMNLLDSISSLPQQLISLTCSNNNLTSLPTLPNNLNRLDVRYNPISTFPQFPQYLNTLDIGYTAIASLPTLSSGIISLNVDGNQISLLNLPSTVKNLVCRDCGLTTLPAFQSLWTLNCSDNSITYIPTMPGLYSLVCDNNPQLHCLPDLTDIQYLRFQNCPVACIPNLGSVTNSNPPLSSLPLCDLFNTNNCDFYWNINGNVFFDSDTDCVVGNNDIKLSNIKLNLYRNNNLIQQIYTDSGRFSFDVDTFDIYTVELDTLNSPFNVRCLSNNTYVDTISVNDSLVYANDFAVECRSNFDLAAWSVMGWHFQPGTQTTVRFQVGDYANLFNASCALGVSGSITITINGHASYTGPAGNLVPSNVSGNVVTYSIADFGTLNALSDIAFIVQTDTTAQSGDHICFNVQVSPNTNDNNPSNNNYTHCFGVVTSYDPNDKTVYPDGIIDTTQEWLTYTVRFQNTGSAPAINIYLLDTIDSNFDISSFQLLSKSHDGVVQILPGNIARFNFPNINLPDSNSNEPLSHGYAQYRIKLKDNLPVGTQIQNTAYIYFDFNPPVVTNTTSNTIDLVNSTDAIRKSITDFKVYPLPFKEQLIITSENESSFMILDVFGRIMLSIKINGQTEVNTSDWNTGIYFVKSELSGVKTVIKY